MKTEISFLKISYLKKPNDVQIMLSCNINRFVIRKWSWVRDNRLLTPFLERIWVYYQKHLHGVGKQSCHQIMNAIQWAQKKHKTNWLTSRNHCKVLNIFSFEIIYGGMELMLGSTTRISQAIPIISSSTLSTWRPLTPASKCSVYYQKMSIQAEKKPDNLVKESSLQKWEHFVLLA